MANVSVTLIGASAIMQKLSVINVRGRAAFKDAIQESTLAIDTGAKQRCPVNKKKGLGGRLRSSIRPRFFNNGFTGEVGTDVEYAKFVEFGTGRRGAGSSHPPLPKDYVYGPRTGNPAQPYLYPAFAEEQPRFIRKVMAIPNAL